MTQETNTSPRFVDLGRIGYRDAFAEQQRLHAAVLAGEAEPTVLLLEHEPVITVSRRDSAMNHLLAAPAELHRLGVAVESTDRGGDITYHGPGQLVAYPILPLQRLGLNVRQYVHTLEQIVIDTLGAFDIQAGRDESACRAVGVWVGMRNGECGVRSEEKAGRPLPCTPHAALPTPNSSKIAAIGVRIQRWVSLHGLALNVTTNLEHFKLIVPCGLTRPVTSMSEQLGARCPSMEEVKSQMVKVMEKYFSLGV